MSFLYATHPLVPFYIFTKYYQNILKGIRVTEGTPNAFQIKQRVISPKVRKPELSFLYACDTSSCPDLHFYQVLSKYSKGYSSYRADKKFYANADGSVTKTICPQTHTHTHRLFSRRGRGRGGGGSDIMTHQPLWVILCHLPGKGRNVWDRKASREEELEKQRHVSKSWCVALHPLTACTLCQ